jgi:thiol-disulfide isomerase/thioredoxin
VNGLRPCLGRRSTPAMVVIALAVTCGCDLSTGGSSHGDPLAANPVSRLLGFDKRADRLRQLQERCEAELRSQNSYRFDFRLESIRGRTVRKAQFANRLLIVDIWATWCGPCVNEIPHFIDLHRRYGQDGLALVGINFEGGASQREDRKAIKDFARKAGIDYPLAPGDESITDQIPDFRGYPTTLFIDGAGQVRLTLRGSRSLEELETFVGLLINDPTVHRREPIVFGEPADESGPPPIQTNPFATDLPGGT